VLAVDRLDLQVRHGEVYGFLGHSGARKTIGSFGPARWHRPAPTLAAL
jgi:ABC-type dipeptide/oligopeptide/nickel transport system ATPase component